MEERLFSINEERIRHPDFSQECPVESQLVQTLCVVAQPFVLPALSEVAVQRVDLAHLVHRTHRPDVEVDVHHDRRVGLGDGSNSPVVAGLEQKVVQRLGSLFTNGIPRSDREENVRINKIGLKVSVHEFTCRMIFCIVQQIPLLYWHDSLPA